MTENSPSPLLAPLPGWTRSVVLSFFFLSGASGLVYEVIWTRMLLTVFGATLYAVATVLAAFMGGLALGSFLGGRVADRLRRPLLVYGVIEVLVAGAALAVPVGLRLFDPLYRAIYSAGETSFLALSLIRFTVSFAVLMVPTTCMGATLPLLSRFMVRRGDRVGGGIGALYAVNTAGAVTGTFLAGFVLIAALGVHGSILTAALVSTLVGLASLGLSTRLEGGGAAAGPATVAAAVEADDGPAPDLTPPWVATLVLATYAVAGCLALSFQVMWTRTLVFRFEVLKNTTYSFSAMLTVFLIGLALGSAVMAARVNRVPDPVRLYGLVQVLTGLAGVLSLFLLLSVVGDLQVADAIGADGKLRWAVATANVFLRTAATILLPTFLMGVAFPLAARVCVRRLRAVGSGTGRLYAFNTVGAIFGSFATGFLVIPVFGLARGMVLLGVGYVVLGVVVLAANPAESRARRGAWALMGAVVVLILVVRTPTGAPFQDVFPGHAIVVDEDGAPAYIEGPLATVSVMESSIGDRTIYIDNASVAGTDRILLTDQKSLAHVPMLLLENPRKVLTVGFGSGGASWSFLQYRELDQVDCIEISPTVPRLYHTLRASNHGVLDGWDRRIESGRSAFSRRSLSGAHRRRAVLPQVFRGALRHHRHRLHRPALQVERQPLRRRVLRALQAVHHGRRPGGGVDAAGRDVAGGLCRRHADLRPRLSRHGHLVHGQRADPLPAPARRQDSAEDQPRASPRAYRQAGDSAGSRGDLAPSAREGAVVLPDLGPAGGRVSPGPRSDPQHREHATPRVRVTEVRRGGRAAARQPRDPA